MDLEHGFDPASEERQIAVPAISIRHAAADCK